MTNKRDLPYHGSRRIKWPLRLTFAGLLAERVLRAFWPLFSIILVALGMVLLGLHEAMPIEVLWTTICVVIGGALYAFGWKKFLGWSYTLNEVQYFLDRIPKNTKNHHHHLHLQGYDLDFIKIIKKY